jgi:8-oxo-dGTP diphosphatase
MSTTETSAGGIVYREDPNGIRILMIADDKGRWSFPKGQVDKGESPRETAVREVKEETGISGDAETELGKTEYFYRKGRLLIHKTVYFYLIRALSDAITPQTSEISDARWFSADDARRRSTFAANTELLEKALKEIDARC